MAAKTLSKKSFVLQKVQPALLGVPSENLIRPGFAGEAESLHHRV
jgi:hypothetical protein